jgi:hypothetical protein
MNKLRAVWLLIAVLVLTVFSGCQSAPPEAAAAPSTPQAVESTENTPDRTVQAFYDWYLAYEGNVLADQAYRERPELTTDFVAKVDEVLVSFDKGGYDPFLCAQDVPEALDLASMDVTDGTAQGVMTSSFGHRFDIELTRGADGWQIADIVCAAPGDANTRPDPTIMVSNFYGWYLSYEGNVLVDQAYQAREELAPDFVTKVEELLATFDKGGYDPFLCAQDKPNAFQATLVDGSETEAKVDVATSFEGHLIHVTAEWTGDRWLLTDVACELSEAPAEPAPEGETPAEQVAPQSGNWFRDEEFGYALVLPEGWTHEDVDLDAPDKPPAGKMDRLVFFLPENWEENFNPLNMEVYTDAAAFEADQMPANESETIETEAFIVTRDTYIFGDNRMVKYIYRSLEDADLLVVFTDYVTGWPERLEGHEILGEQVPMIVNSLSFTR